jgi:putative transposase
MPRRPREFVEGAIYHVYNRFARGAEIFSDCGEAERFLDLLVQARDRDGLTILAWCLMSNHYHLAVRVGTVSLARSLGIAQARFGQDHNRRTRSSGPLWQSRFKAKRVTDERHLMQLFAYVHLNPVATGLVADPADYPLSGHGELLGRRKARLVDVDGALALFDTTRVAARRAYLGVVKGDREAEWVGEEPGKLPWWRQEPDAPLEAEPAAPRLDPLGRSLGSERPQFDAATFIERACEVLDVSPESLSSALKGRDISEARYLVGGLAIERWRLRAGELAAVLGKRPEVITRWAAQAGKWRQAEESFRRRYEELDEALYYPNRRKRQRGRSL